MLRRDGPDLSQDRMAHRTTNIQTKNGIALDNIIYLKIFLLITASIKIVYRPVEYTRVLFNKKLVEYIKE